VIRYKWKLTRFVIETRLITFCKFLPVMRWAGHVARMGKERDVYRFLVGKPEGRRPMGRPRRRWVDNIRMDLRGTR